MLKMDYGSGYWDFGMMCEPTDVTRCVAPYEASRLDSAEKIPERESSVLLSGLDHVFPRQLRLYL